MIENTAVAELLELVMHDRWRDDHPFSPDIVGCQSKLLNPALSRADKAKELLTWLSSTAYPCIFGRIAAKHGQTSVLVLEERDLLRSDREIENLLRDARLEWKRDALEGKKHALVLAAVSPQLANASPDENLCRLTARLCELYLRHGVVPNEILRDELHLRVRFGEPGIIRWQAGVDSFAAPGDQRWWQDHRIPGGICIVINSVGHMARSMIDKALDKDSSLRADIEKMTYEKLTRWALPFAMRTI
jgi:hypothetical protein